MMMNIETIIKTAKEMGTSDIHIVCGLPIRFRIHGSLENAEDEILTHDQCEMYARELAEDLYDIILNGGELDLARSIADTRVRINLFRQQGHVSAAIRLLSDNIPSLENLGLPPAVLEFPNLRRGIVLVTGETGSGKSTTLAAILDKINHDRPAHILTLEDPVEYIYTPDKCIINQREIGKDTGSFSDGLRAALREDPDVILIGEMRDLETIEAAITAAETGHLVFATLHTNSAADSIDRIVDVFPEGRHRQIRMQLSTALQAVLSQQLLPNATNTGRSLACEVMIVTSGIRNLIREGKTPMLQNAIATSASEGSITMDNALIRLVNDRLISNETALLNAHDTEYIKKYVGGRPSGMSNMNAMNQRRMGGQL